MRPISASGWRTVVGVGVTIDRVDYIHGHLDAAWRAIQDGVT